MMGYVDMIKLLLSAGANVNATDKWGDTALMQACSEGKFDIVKLLLASGANVNVRNKETQTALRIAENEYEKEYKKKYKKIIDLLLQYGARE